MDNCKASNNNDDQTIELQNYHVRLYDNHIARQMFYSLVAKT